MIHKTSFFFKSNRRDFFLFGHQKGFKNTFQKWSLEQN